MSNISPWDALDLENTDNNQADAEQARLEIKRRFRDVFGSDNGQWVLEYLNGRYFNKPVVDENHQNVIAAAGIREGELRLLRFIHLMLRPEK